MNLLAVNAMTDDVPVPDSSPGVMPLLISRVILLVALPSISLFLVRPLYQA